MLELQLSEIESNRNARAEIIARMGDEYNRLSTELNNERLKYKSDVESIVNAKTQKEAHLYKNISELENALNAKTQSDGQYVSTLKHQIESLRKDTADKEHQIESLRKDTADKEHQIESLRKDTADKEHQIESLQLKLQENEETHTAKVSHLNSIISASNERSRVVGDDFLSQLNTSKNHIDELNAKLQDSSNIRTQCEFKISEFHDQLKKAEFELKTRDLDLERIRGQCESFSSTISGQRNDISSLTSQLKSASSAIEQLQMIKQTNEQLSQDNVSMISSTKELTKKLQDRNEKYSELKSSFSKQKEALSKQKALAKAAEDTVAQLKNQLKQFSQMQREHSQLSAYKEECDATITTLDKKLKQQRAMTKQLQLELTQFKSQLKSAPPIPSRRGKDSALNLFMDEMDKLGNRVSSL